MVKHVRKPPAQWRASRGDVISYPNNRVTIRLRNDRQDAPAYYRDGQGRWVKMERSDDISGLHHNVFGGFISVRPGIFATGKGKATFTYFKYRSLD